MIFAKPGPMAVTLFDSTIAPSLKSLTISNIYASILSKELIMLMGFPRVGAAFTTKLLKNSTNDSCMIRGTNAMGFFNVGHSIEEA